ncbi:acetylornithine deacetylase [Rhodothalassium salexigens]|uniref:acetylornithine deacetylase n=1 Tax=Rhodothalassium salexigens TaxID=1086 RepID=UPI001914675D|nr:acetylornithine deacetylase [Rhodothalassium salexigens]MBK5911551.1 acetylornithine deacetylase [Rhodothalassium salexigens]
MPSQHALDLIATLIAFPTVSRDGNAELIDFLDDHLRRAGAEVALFRHAHEPKANLLATIRPRDPVAARRPGVLLSGHTDVVPVDGQPWTADPFTARVADGRLYGRGACDMKGFLGLVLARVPQMVAADLTRPIHLAFSYDEEVGCAGVRSLVDHLAGLATPPALCIVGEPTEMTAVTGHKGIRVVRTEITGRAGHSSAPAAGANAAVAAGRFAVFLDDLARDLAAAPPAPGFEPPYSTLNVGRIDAGSAVNIIADHATVMWEYRSVPGADADAPLAAAQAFAETDLLPGLRATAPEAAIAFAVEADAPALSPLDHSPATELVLRLLGANQTQAVSFATEAGLFQHRAGIPSVVCGPGSIAQAHKADEYVRLDQLDACDRFLTRLIDELSA